MLILKTEIGPLQILIGVILALLGLGFVFLLISYGGLWLRARFAEVKIGLLEILFIRVRGIPPRFIVDALVSTVQARVRGSPSGSDEEVPSSVTTVVWPSPARI